MRPALQPLHDAAATRELEHLAAERLGIASYELMERAGAAVYRCLRARWPAARRVLVVCGAGNNGGDGYVVARLAAADGLAVRVAMLAAPERVRGDALLAYRAMLAAGLVPGGAAWNADDGEVLVDALLGTGLERAVTGAYAEAIARINASGLPVLAVDVPSGIDATSGQRHGLAVQASATLSLVTLKQGLVTGDAPAHTGELLWDGIDLPPACLAEIAPGAWAVDHAGHRALFAPRSRTAHKGHHGHVLVLGGAPGYAGAARMAAEAAARVGAGLVTLATHPSHAAASAAQRPEIMCHGVADAADLAPLLARATVVAVGPGLAQGDWSRRLWAAVRETHLMQVVDADGLNLLAADPDTHPRRILTPHPGEAARLLGTDTAAIHRDRYAAARALAARYGGVALLKGAGTVVATDGEAPRVARGGNPGMASGGMGDVLTGVVAGLAAQGFDLLNAATAGACLHAWAADQAAAEGERGLLASDLMPHLRRGANPP